MTSVFSIPGPASALLLLALLAACAGMEYVSTDECARSPHGSMPVRVRQYPADRNATWFWLFSCNLTQINLEDLAGLPKMEYILLGSNKLRELPVFEYSSCPSLVGLYLSNNQLTAIDNDRTFSSCIKLKILDLGHNNIEYIHPNAFKSLTELESLDLSYNAITSIPAQMFASNGKLDYLDLNNNRITHLPPKFVSGLKHAGTSVAEFWFFDNPWHCACLLELLLDVHKTGVRNYAHWRYRGNMPVCVYTDASGLRPAPRAECGDRS